VPGLAEQWDEHNARFKALGNWVRSVAKPFDLLLAKGKEGSALASAWARRRQQRAGFAEPEHPFRLIGSGKQNAYKLFAEVFWNLLRVNGRTGVILPTGIYSDLGTKDLRETLLNMSRIELLYAFQNEKRVFSAAHHSFKQVALIAAKGGPTSAFRTRFRMGVGDSPEAHEIPDDMLRRDSAAMEVTPEDVKSYSPNNLTFVELKTERDLANFRTIYAASVRIGDKSTDWEINFGREYNLTDDSKLFPPRMTWESKGYKPDDYGRWINSNGDVALPVYQGAMFHHFCPGFQSFGDSGGRSNDWFQDSTDSIRFLPKFLASDGKYFERFPIKGRMKIALRDIARNTDERTLICCVIPNFPAGHTTPTFQPVKLDLYHILALSGMTSSLVIDYVARSSMSGSHMSYFVFSELPIPVKYENRRNLDCLALSTARLSLVHRRFAPEWLKIQKLYPELAGREWKHWWAVTEADRLRLRAEIDAICADLYGLAPDDFDWIVRDDPTDPKGFYRVDRQLPFRERLTGLAAAAFRALKDGRWSAESADSLSNDEFFEIVGIPELTNPQAARSMGLPGPLIEKRDGCHVWKPENFPEDDPRHGWTWDDCWNDALALLGSEQSVRDYIEANPSSDDAKIDNDDGQFRLQAEDRLRQHHLF
jgi:hypothetical protein